MGMLLGGYLVEDWDSRSGERKVQNLEPEKENHSVVNLVEL